MWSNMSINVNVSPGMKLSHLNICDKEQLISIQSQINKKQNTFYTYGEKGASK